MKLSKFIYLFLLLLSCDVKAQDTSGGIFHLHNIPLQGVLLDKGWKFNAGDKPEWSLPEYDDKTWTSINPTKDLHHLPQVKQAGIGWFRLTMKIDSSLWGETLAMVVSNLTASEIYLNGKLIYSFGVVSRDYEKEKTDYFFNHLLSLRLSKQPLQLIAVRFSFNKKNLYLKFTNARSVVHIILKETNRAFIDHTKNSKN
jgi:hypothetical protein